MISREGLTEPLATQMLETIRCESGFVSQQSKYIRKDGTREPSFGIAQIHLPDHPSVTKDEAMDENFSVRWMAKKFKDGKMGWWTCWRDKYGE